MFTRAMGLRASLTAIVVMSLTCVVGPTWAKAPAPPPSYSYTIKLLPPYLDATGKSLTLGFSGMNNWGDVVGSIVNQADNRRHGVLYTPETGWIDLNWVYDDPETHIVGASVIPENATAVWVTYANAINDAGQIAGFLDIRIPTDGYSHGYPFRYTPATSTTPPTFEILAVDGYCGGSGTAINQLGDVAGTINKGPQTARDGFLWSDGMSSVIPYSYTKCCINNRAQVAGTLLINGQYVGYRYTPAYIDSSGTFHPAVTLTFLPFGTSTTGWKAISICGIDDDGDMAGWSTVAGSNGERAFKFLNGQQMVNLGTLGGFRSDASAIISSETTGAVTIAGVSALKNGELHPFVYTDKMRDLFTLIDPATRPTGMKAGDLADANLGMNDLGQMAGMAQFSPSGGGPTGSSGLYGGRLFVITPKP